MKCSIWLIQFHYFKIVKLVQCVSPPTSYPGIPGKPLPLSGYATFRFWGCLSKLPPAPSCSLCRANTDWAKDVIFVPLGLKDRFAAVDPRLPPTLVLLSSDWLELPAPNWDANGLIEWCSVVGWDTRLKYAGGLWGLIDLNNVGLLLSSTSENMKIWYQYPVKYIEIKF